MNMPMWFLYVLLLSKEEKCGGKFCANKPCHASVNGGTSRKPTASPAVSNNFRNAGSHQ
ncbi:hypothetical protein PVAP13_1NG162819 [Panicum virgatum]|uniref:Uncharacterized protein n=1 Tax=Panicum virgatum TaxID=38727 RepID=A0A8T0WWA2_PANVG|nr:hypothetical protein PVAP13_1NG162819 [Panicum virgatum]